MDLTIRDWMVIIGAGLILAVLVDAARRVYRERRSEVRLNAKITPAGEDGSDSDFNLLSELPNGGARIIRRDDLMPPQRDDAPVAAAAGDTVLPSAAATGLDNAATMSAVNAPDLDAAATAEELPAEANSRFAEAQWDDDSIDDLDTATAATGASARGDTAPSSGSKSDAKDELIGGFSSRDEQPETLDWLEQLEPDVAQESEPDARLPRGIEPHVFVLNVVARADAGFSGKDILHILLACDLRFGDMDFFPSPRAIRGARTDPIQRVEHDEARRL
jgi:cell division protein ZipA